MKTQRRTARGAPPENGALTSLAGWGGKVNPALMAGEAVQRSLVRTTGGHHNDWRMVGVVEKGARERASHDALEVSL